MSEKGKEDLSEFTMHLYINNFSIKLSRIAFDEHLEFQLLLANTLSNKMREFGCH